MTPPDHPGVHAFFGLALSHSSALILADLFIINMPFSTDLTVKTYLISAVYHPGFSFRSHILALLAKFRELLTIDG